MAYGDSASDRLAAVRSAISDILTNAQAMSTSQRRIEMANLATLRQMEKELAIEVAQESQGNAVCSVMTQVPVR